MDLRRLIADLPGKTGMVHTFERGKALHYSHASLHGEVIRVRQALLDWRVRPGHVEVIIGSEIDVPLGVSRPREKAILAETREQLERMLDA